MSAYSDLAINDPDNDMLGRDSLLNALSDILSADNLSTPLTVGIYGGWGEGKTSMMRMLKKRISPNPKYGPIPIWFDAWKYARSETALWRALLLEVVEKLGDLKDGLPARLDADQMDERKRIEDLLEKMRTSLYRSQSWTEKGDMQVNWFNIPAFAADLGLRFAGLSEKIGFKDVVEHLTGKDAKEALKVIEQNEIEHHREKVTSLEQFQRDLDELVQTEIVAKNIKLFVFIDDLDRCLPEEAIAALEAVKLFFDMTGCVFVLGMDRDVVERGLIERYPPVKVAENEFANRVDPHQYLDKIVQLPLTLPPLTTGQIRSLLDGLLAQPGTHGRLVQCRDLIETAAPSNPRTVKRILNVLSLLLPLDGVGEPQQARRLAKLALMQILFETNYEAVVENPEYLRILENQAGGASDEEMKGKSRDARLNRLLMETPDFNQMSGLELENLVAQTQITATSQTTS